MNTYIVRRKSDGTQVYHYSTEGAVPIEWVGMEFSTHDHVLVVDEPTSQPAYAGSWHISKTAFRNRFTQSERVSLELAALHNATLTVNHPSNLLAAALRSSMADQRDAMYIDLQRATVSAGVQALEGAGLLAPGRTAQIMLTPPTDEELYRG